MSVVIDASITVAWLFPDEVSPTVHRVFLRVEAAGAFVPSLWKFEIANVLQMAVRSGRYAARFRDKALAELAVLNIEADTSETSLIWNRAVQLADQHRLTVYDATYLELAIRRNLPLATLDDDLRAAAEREGVPLMGHF